MSPSKVDGRKRKKVRAEKDTHSKNPKIIKKKDTRSGATSVHQLRCSSCFANQKNHLSFVCFLACLLFSLLLIWYLPMLWFPRKRWMRPTSRTMCSFNAIILRIKFDLMSHYSTAWFCDGPDIVRELDFGPHWKRNLKTCTDVVCTVNATGC